MKLRVQVKKVESTKAKDCNESKEVKLQVWDLVSCTKELRTNVQGELHKRTSLRLILDAFKYLYR